MKARCCASSTHMDPPAFDVDAELPALPQSQVGTHVDRMTWAGDGQWRGHRRRGRRTGARD
ncbi:protein of unknown function (plasmid) [Rhodovastum atsumiense]|nr:protein of unknown function [Rhodovastum atsumiense]